MAWLSELFLRALAGQVGLGFLSGSLTVYSDFSKEGTDGKPKIVSKTAYGTNFAKYGDLTGRRSAVAGLPGRESRGDVVPADAAHGTGSDRGRAEGAG